MRVCRRRRCHAPSDCCGRALYVLLWPHGFPLPGGAAAIEGAVITDLHRYWTTIISIEGAP